MHPRNGRPAVRVDHEPPSPANTRRGPFPRLICPCYFDFLPYRLRFPVGCALRTGLLLLRNQEAISIAVRRQMMAGNAHPTHRLFIRLIAIRSFDFVIQAHNRLLDIVCSHPYMLSRPGGRSYKIRVNLRHPIVPIFKAFVRPVSPHRANIKIGCQP